MANHQDTLYGKRRRVEHWDNAVSQASTVPVLFWASVRPFVHVPYCFSDVFDLSYELWGDPADADEIVERGELSGPSFSIYFQV